MLNRFDGIPGGFSWHSNYVDDKGAVMEVEISRGLLNIAEGLLFLQNVQRRLHLNVSPENIVVTPGGLWKLCGFGFSLGFQNDEYQIASPYFITSSLSTSSAAKLIRLEPDLCYCSPELTHGGGNAIRYAYSASDFFSLGVTAYEAFRYNLKLAKDGVPNSNLLKVQDGNIHQHQAAISTITSAIDTSSLPPGVYQLVLGMLQVSPAARISPNDVVNNSYFHSGPIAVLRSLDNLHTRFV